MFLFPKRREYTSVPENPSAGAPLPVNKSLFAHFTGSVSKHRLVGLTLHEAAVLEGLFRSQTEDLSHTLWILSGLIGLLRHEGFSPRDPVLFNKFVSSLSMGLSQQAHFACGGATYFTLKRRQFYLSHLPHYIPPEIKTLLLSSPTSLVPLLFDEPLVTNALQYARDASSFRSQQAMIDLASRSSVFSNRSPGRQSYYSPRSDRKRRRSRSPSPRPYRARSPKRVRFNSKTSTKSPPASTKQDFQK